MNKFLHEIQQQPESILSCASFIDSIDGSTTLSNIVNLWKSGKYNKIILTGMGSSFFLSSAAASLMSAQHIPAVAINAGELLHYQLNCIDNATLLICISQSGESYEVIRLIDTINPNVKVIGICNIENSTLHRRADEVLLCKAGLEEMTSTKTFITGFQLIYILSMAIAGVDISNISWQHIADEITRIINIDSKVWMENALNLLGNTPFIQLVSRGTTFATASQSALMFMEATHTPASALLGGEFRHGPIEMVKDGFILVLFGHSKSCTYQSILKLLNDVLKFGGKVIFITDKPIESHNNLCTIIVNCDDETLFAIPSLIPVQLIINFWAERQGIVPGNFTHGAKVTAIE